MTCTTWPRAASRKSHKDHRKFGCAFVEEFAKNFGNSYLPLRSKDPGICWKAGGFINYATVMEYSGPNTSETVSPLIFKIQVNVFPPPALSYHLRSPAARRQLGVNRNTGISNEPQIELHVLPIETPQFGAWLPTWIDANFCQRLDAPKPPSPLIWWTWDENGEDLKLDYESLIGPQWRAAMFVWTPTAAAAHEEWLRSLD